MLSEVKENTFAIKEKIVTFQPKIENRKKNCRLNHASPPPPKYVVEVLAIRTCDCDLIWK